jgi:hypothetical protein
MALSSSTFALPKDGGAKAKRRKDLLLKRHRAAVEKVLADAKTFSDDRKRDLDKIDDESLRRSATR